MTLYPPKISRWENVDDLQMLLLFAHRLEELLFDYTVDSYKARALNLHSSLIELKYRAQEVRQGESPLGVLNPLLSELESQIRTDPVLTSSQRDTFLSYHSQIAEQSPDPELIIDTVDALLTEVSTFYWTQLLSQIRSTVRAENESSLVTSLANTFVCECELQGFDRGFIFYRTIRHFWRQPVVDHTVIDDFLEDFNSSEREWSFIFRVTSAFLTIQDLTDSLENITIQEDAPDIDPDNTPAQRFLNAPNEEHPHYALISQIRAKDPVTARSYANTPLERLSDAYGFHIPQKKIAWSKQALCLDEDGDVVTILKPSTSPMKRRAHSSVEDKTDGIGSFLEVLTGQHYTINSTYRFKKSLDNYRSASNSDSTEAQLVSLWAGLESFLPSPSRGEGNRISHFTTTLLPSLTLTYPEKLLRYACTLLSNCRGEVTQYLEDLTISDHPFDTVVQVITCEDLEEERNQLYALLAEHPLLRFRCFRLNKQFRTAERTYSTIKEHRQRVEWHIQRIYATRNQIVHSADALPYLDTLVENLRAYLEELLTAVARVGLTSQRRASIEAGLQVLNIHSRQYTEELKSRDGRVNTRNYRTHIFGSSNPLSPYVEGLTP